MSDTTLGLLLLTGSHERAHYAFTLAAGAAALDRHVVVFASNRGCLALMRDWQGLGDAGRDSIIRRRGVAGLDELRDVAIEFGVVLLACEAGLRAEALDPADLLPSVAVAGIATLLHQVGPGQIVTL